MKTIITVLILAALVVPAWADTAVFREVKGKVEYQTQGDEWLPAKVGVEVPVGTAISTGFKSTAAVEILGSVVFVKPLTRMVIDDLARNSTGTKTSLTLLAGKVKAEVKPSSATSETTFNVKSPTATASVRGTGFEFDGQNLLVNHGDVKLANRFNISRSVQGGEFSSAGRGASVSAPVPVKPADKQVITAGGGQEEVDAMFQETPATVGPAAPPTPPTIDLSTVIQTYGNQLILVNGVTSTSEVQKEVQQATQAVQAANSTTTVSVSVQ